VRSWLENWLIAGLFLNWIGLMVQRYWSAHKDYCQPPKCPWWYEVLGILLWPFAFALGFVISHAERQRRKKK
jgi:hypothetical protein